MRYKIVMQYCLLFSVGFIWGGHFLFNGIAIQTLSPTVIAASSVVIGAITMTMLSWLVKKVKPQVPSTTSIKSEMSRSSLYVRYVLIALFEGIIPVWSIAWGQQYVDSSVAAVLTGTIPIFTGIFVLLFITDEKMTRGLVISVILGFVGLCILVAPALISVETNHILGNIAVLVGAISFAIGSVLLKSMPTSISPIRLTRNMMILSAIPLSIYALISGAEGLFHLSGAAFFSLLMLGTLCYGLVYILYVKLINEAGATFASLSNYLVPVFGAMLGVLVLHDPLNWTLMAALAVILISLIASRYS